MRKVLLALVVLSVVAVAVAAEAADEAKRPMAKVVHETAKAWLRENAARIREWGHATNERYVERFSERMKGK